MVDGGDLFREGVNLAGRLQGMAEPGGVLISQAVYDQVRSKLPVGYEFLGQRRPKNLDDPVPVYRLLFDGRQPPRAAWPGIGKLGVWAYGRRRGWHAARSMRRPSASA